MAPSKWFTTNSSTNSLVISKKNALPLPNGLVESNEGETSVAETTLSIAQLTQAKQRQAMAMATGPLKGLFSTAFMLWMSGSTIQIFSIMMTGMALINPIKAIFGTSQTFRGFNKPNAPPEEHIDLTLPKLIYISVQLLALGVGLYKCFTMGLLPITVADWSNILPLARYKEVSMVPLRGIN